MNIIQLIDTWMTNNPGIELKLYSPIIGEAKATLDANRTHLILTSGTSNFTFDTEGKLNEQGACVVYPSETVQDWNKFDTSSSLCNFKPGDIVTNGTSTSLVEENIVTGFKTSLTYTTKISTTSQIITDWKKYFKADSSNFVSKVAEFGYKVEGNKYTYDNTLAQLNEIKRLLTANSEADTTNITLLSSKITGLQSDLDALKKQINSQATAESSKTEGYWETLLNRYVWPALTVLTTFVSGYLLYKIHSGGDPTVTQ